MEEIIDGKTLSITNENINKLKEMFPDVFVEDKIDFEKLQLLLGNTIADDKNEKYQMTWNGKSEAIRIAQQQSTGTLRPCKEESKNWDNTKNLYIEGDNLEVLKLLQASYKNSIKMIYIDPPYNTGSDFVYEDNFADNIDNYKMITGQTTKSNPETSGRFHSKWLNMMYPRLKLSRFLLSEDGVIFISIGQKEVQNLIKCCDEIFGEYNCVGIISRLMKSGGNKGQYFSPNIEYILVYAKNIEMLGFFREPISDELIEKVYNQVETEGDKKGQKYRIMGLYQAGLDIRPNQRYWIQCPDGSFAIPSGETFPEIKKNGEKIIPKDGDGVWRWSAERFMSELSNNNILFKKTSTSSLVDENGNKSQWNIYTKIWLDDRLEEGRVPVDLITKWENRLSSQELKELEIPFDFAKPVELIKYLISIIDNNTNMTILDFFSGSATTAHSVMQLNTEDGGKRKFIMVQLPEICDEKSEAYKCGYKNICEIGKERIRRAGDKLKRENPNKELDNGFRVYKLDSSNLRKWDNTPTNDIKNIQLRIEEQIEYIKPDRTNYDIVNEIMLKSGLPLEAKVEEKEIKNVKLYIVDNELYKVAICLDKITLEAIEEMLSDSKDVGTFIFADKCFENANMIINTREILKRENKNMRLF